MSRNGSEEMSDEEYTAFINGDRYRVLALDIIKFYLDNRVAIAQRLLREGNQNSDKHLDNAAKEIAEKLAGFLRRKGC
jgi:hypothetical protein